MRNIFNTVDCGNRVDSVKHCRLLTNPKLQVTSAKQLIHHMAIQIITPSHTPSSLALSNDGKSLLVTYHNGTILYAYTLTGQRLLTLKFSFTVWRAIYAPRDYIIFATTVHTLENAADLFAVNFGNYSGKTHRVKELEMIELKAIQHTKFIVTIITISRQILPSVL